MEAIKMREKLIDVINNADEGLLHVVQEVVDNYKYGAGKLVSEPISAEQYNKEIDIAEQNIKSGEVFTQAEVGEIIKRWKNG
ncbi:MAG: hypothetical protein EOO88_49265 [Pedobacter sp.]|nr:MAG: hypothetical protein EOO88_49265 [Pedobacter sp.]